MGYCLKLSKVFGMNTGKTLFSQLIDFAPRYLFQKSVKKYSGSYNPRKFSYWDHFLCMAFAQVTHRESLRDIEASLRTANHKLYHLGIRGKISRSTLSDANEKRDWRIFAASPRIFAITLLPVLDLTFLINLFTSML